MSNKDVLAATGGLGSLSLSLQTFSSEPTADANVTLLSSHDSHTSLEGLVDRLKADGTQKKSCGSEEEADASEDLLSFALQMPSHLDDIVDFDIRCRLANQTSPTLLSFSRRSSVIPVFSGPWIVDMNEVVN